jgi:hypothetical protein
MGLFLFNSSPVLAWNATGHMIIAHIAYQQLSPAARTKINNLIGHFKTEYPEYDSFVKIASWADAIRSQRIEAYTHWHYIDVAFSDDGSPLKDLIDTDNAVWAEKNIEAVVTNDHANDYERVRFLAFLVHIVGDLHQPLHTVSRISAKHPDGDKGGNDFVVKINNEKFNLHRVWDGGVGVFESNKSMEVNDLAETITSRYPITYFGAAANDIKADDWVKEGFKNAKDYVYNTKENENLTPEYMSQGKELAQKQVALAGYRLGNLLNTLLAK